MNDHRDDIIAEDVQAFVRVTSRDLPPLERFAGGQAQTTRNKQFRGDNMSISTNSIGRRFAITAVVTAVVAAVLFLVPVSYNRVIGWETSLELSAKNLSPEALQPIAEQLKTLTGAPAVRVELQARPQEQLATLTAFVDAQQSKEPKAALEAFARFMNTKGYRASALVKPRLKTVSSNVWAMTLEKVIYIETAGKSPEELEEEILTRLEEAGFQDPEVQVTKEQNGEGEDVKILIGAKCETDGGDSEPSPLDCPNLVLTKNGQIPDGERVMIRRTKELIDGEEVTVFLLEFGDDKATVRIENIENRSDEELTGLLREQLQAQGIELEVTVENGKIKVGPHQL